MSRPSPFEYDVSVSADKARRRGQSGRRGMSGAVEGSTKTCEHPDCDRTGAYRAPYSPDELDRFRWFCLDHVRAYNAAWNFFKDHSAEDFEAYMERSRVWDRPTWGFGDQPKGPAGMHPHGEGRAWERHGFRDPFEVLGARATINGGGVDAPQERRRRKLPSNVRRALDILGAPHTETRAEIRRRYRELVKNLHPDMNGGDRREEGRLRRVLWAWDQIKTAAAFRE
jgi:hypothetical protein